MEKCEWDYYAILNVPRNATKEEIALAYRNLAIRFHPHSSEMNGEREYDPTLLQSDDTRDNHHLDTLSSCKRWHLVNMAYHIICKRLSLCCEVEA